MEDRCPYHQSTAISGTQSVSETAAYELAQHAGHSSVFFFFLKKGSLPQSQFLGRRSRPLSSCPLSLVPLSVNMGHRNQDRNDHKCGLNGCSLDPQVSFFLPVDCKVE